MAVHKRPRVGGPGPEWSFLDVFPFLEVGGTARWVWRFTELLSLLGLHLRAAVVGERVSRVPLCCVWVVAPDVIGVVVGSGGQF